MSRALFTGAVIGILLDRAGIHKVMQQKNQELEKARENFMVMGQWLTLYEHGKTVEDALKKRGISRIAIYGMGVLGHHLYQQLKSSGVYVKYIMDQNSLKGLYKAEICKVGAELQEIDAVIVTPVYQFEEIKKQMRQFYDIPMVSLLELLEEC